MGKEETPDQEISKAMRDSLSKAKENATLTHKSVNLETAQNGIIMRVNEEYEINRAGKSGKDWKFIHRNYIFTDMKTAIPKMEEEMSKGPGEKISMAELQNRMSGESTKVHAVAKRQMTFVVGEGDGHIHFATGEIVDVKEGNETVKVFKGETLPDRIYGLMGESNDPDSAVTLRVKATLKAHAHKFQIKLSKDDEAGSRIYGTTDKIGEHSHAVDILDIVSNFVSNTPDKE